MDHEGYDHEGYDREGYDRQGYDRDWIHWSDPARWGCAC